jgi:hypothetical protein
MGMKDHLFQSQTNAPRSTVARKNHVLIRYQASPPQRSVTSSICEKPSHILGHANKTATLG